MNPPSIFESLIYNEPPSKIIRLDNLLIDKEIENDLICGICSSLLVDNRQGCKEGHVFCLSCITSWLEKSKSCPCCRSEINSTEILSKNRYIDKVIEKLKIYCPNKFKNYENVGDDTSLELIESNDGCNEIITIGEKKLHLENCKFKLVNCENFGCTLKIRLNQLDQHMNQECDFKLIECKNYGCKFRFIKSLVLTHQDENCPFGIIECKNKSCGELVERQLYNQHIESICKYELIECEFKQGGCTNKFERGKKEQHYSSINHTEFSSKIINDQKLLLSETMDKLAKLQIEFDKNLKAQEEIKNLSTTSIFKIIGNFGENDRFYYQIDDRDNFELKSKSDKDELYEVETLGLGNIPLKRGVQISSKNQSLFGSMHWMTFFKVEKNFFGQYETYNIIVKVTKIE